MRALKIMAAAVLIWASLALTVAIHDQAQAAQLDRAYADWESQRADSIAAISGPEDAELERLGLTD